jgi:UDP-N-acetylmuramoylalanine--D-glutamate ligase
MDIYKNKKFGVFGLGLSGLATMKYLKDRKADFIAYDDKIHQIQGFDKYLTDLTDPRWSKLDYLILSPGIPLYFPKPHQVVELARSNNAKIICDIELLYLDNPNAYFIGITGTNGKSTTTALITHILNYNGKKAIAAGNIGTPVLSIDNRSNDLIFVIEASSFQLDLLDQTKFNIALLLNITPDHLDRHGNMENYAKSKYRIFAHQTDEDHAIIHKDLPQITNSSSFSEEENYSLPKNNSLLGKHNQQNAVAAISCCLKYGLKLKEIIAALDSFIGLKHRMQYLGTYNGITFINDSKATNADSTAKALASFDDIIWIVGGVQKEGGITSLKEFFPKVKKALLIGKSSDDFARTCDGIIPWEQCDNLENAFNIAYKIAVPGDVVLLSPACASYDQWKNFEERGEAFIRLFQENLK